MEVSIDPEAARLIDPLHAAGRSVTLVSGEQRRFELAFAAAHGLATLVITGAPELARVVFAAKGSAAPGRILALAAGIDGAEAARRAAEIRASRYAVVAAQPDWLWHARLADAIAAWRPAFVVVDLAIVAAHAAERWLVLEETLRRIGMLCPDAALAVLDIPQGPQARALLARAVGAAPHIATPVLPTHVALSVRRVAAGSRAQLLAAAPEVGSGCTLVLAPSRRIARGLSAALTRMGRQAGLYHAGLPAAERLAAVEAYRAGRQTLLVTTAAILELPDLPAPHAVVLSHPPGTLDVLLRLAEARAGSRRDTALLMLWASGDLETLGSRARQAIPTLAGLRHLYAILRGRGAGGQVYLTEDELDSRDWSGRPQPLRLRGGLALLELAGYLERRAGVARAGALTLLADPPPGDLGRVAAATAAQHGVPRPIDLLGLATMLGLDPARLQDTLLQAEAANILGLRLVGHHALYEFVRAPAGAADRVRQILATLAAAAEDDAARTAAFLGAPGCRARALMRALDLPDVAECGRCDICAGGTVQTGGDLPFHLALAALAGVPLGVRPGAARRLVRSALRAAGREISQADAAEMVGELARRGWVVSGAGRLGEVLQVSAAGLNRLAAGS